MIDRATVDKIMDATNIVDVVSDFVTLRKAGVNYKGLCPFHDDTTPSFMVSPSKQICKCFACGKGGNAINFLMEHEQITYVEALRWLARKYNIEIEERELTDEERRLQGERESMFVVNEWGAKYFNDILFNDVDGQAIGKQYFRSRGIRDDIMRKFLLGYALPKRTALLEAAQAKGYQTEYLIKTGLCIENERGIYDRYAGRVIFPWFNVSGKVVAFGGRVLDSRTKGVQQKYVNSPDSDIYHKDHELYGLFQAKRAIAKEDCVYMVEGYTDVIAMHQCGIENVVANSGTALSEYQIRLLHRFTQNIVLLYDGDEAGIHAAMRGTDMLLAAGMNVKVLLLPDGDDPDSFSRKHNADEFSQYIQQHQTDFIQFKSDLMLRGVTDPVKRSEAISNIVKSVSVIPEPIKRDSYLHDCAMRFGMNEQSLISTMNNYIRANREEKRDPASRTSTPAPQTSNLAPQPSNLALRNENPIEAIIIREVVRHGGEIVVDGLETEDGDKVSLTVAQYIDYDLSQDGLQLQNPLFRQILDEAVAHSADSDFNAEMYFMRHPDVEISRLAADLAINRYQLSRSREIPEREGSLRNRVEHLMLDYRMDIVEKQMKQIQMLMREAGNNMERIRELMEQYKQTQELRNALAKKLCMNYIS